MGGGMRNKAISFYWILLCVIFCPISFSPIPFTVNLIFSIKLIIFYSTEKFRIESTLEKSRSRDLCVAGNVLDSAVGSDSLWI